MGAPMDASQRISMEGRVSAGRDWSSAGAEVVAIVATGPTDGITSPVAVSGRHFPESRQNCPLPTLVAMHVML